MREKKRQLITDKPLSLPSAYSPAPSLSTSISPFFLLSLFFFNSVSFHFEGSVLGSKGGSLPQRIKSGLQSCDECSHECSHRTSLALVFLSPTAPNLATVAERVNEILYYLLPACQGETLIWVKLHYIRHFNSFSLLTDFYFHFFNFSENGFSSRMLLAAQRGIISCIPAFS